MKSLKKLLGDYEQFFLGLYNGLSKLQVNIKNIQISHLTYRVEKIDEYEHLKNQLQCFSNEFVETQFNGRAVSIFVLEQSLELGYCFKTDVIELPAPRLVHMYPTGLESLGFIVGKQLPEFIKRYNEVLTGIKDHGIHCQPAFITFENEKTAKFYDISLKDIIHLQGWKLEKQTKRALPEKLDYSISGDQMFA